MSENSIKINDFVIRFANVNGTGSASANTIFAKSVFRMGIPMAAKNIFPSNIQGLPTWYEVRVSEKGYMGRRDGVDLMASLNPQSMEKDVHTVMSGGYFLYDSTKLLHKEFIREDITYIGIPMMAICMKEYTDARQRQLFKNMIYVGALAQLINMDLEVVKSVISDEFKKKPKLIEPNLYAINLGVEYVKTNYPQPLNLQLQTRDLVADKIIMNGNTASGIGAIYAGATVAAWYPITPSTSLVNAYEKYANKLRIDAETGLKKFAVVQAEDELAAIGMVIGASWNGARAFTSTSGPGVSLMNEFLGLAYFAEIPTVLFNVQRAGPSTGMPTRTQQSDILLSAYASHGDTKQVLLFPSTPAECFEMGADAFDLAEGLQTPVLVMLDLDLGMNDHLSEPLKWDDNRSFDRGRVLSAEQLEEIKSFGRYLDDEGTGISNRTIPGTHPTKGSFFTRGTSRDEFARYTEDGDAYVRNMQKLERKWNTAKTMVPDAEFYQNANQSDTAIVFFGTTTYAALEVMDELKSEGILMDAMRVKAFPFTENIENFINDHETVFVIEQNRDAQFRSLLINELEINPKKLVKVLNYDGMPITARNIRQQMTAVLKDKNQLAINN
jgi:2-oxoglutarate ferredoxin oxidoreductase subunit alpha